MAMGESSKRAIERSSHNNNNNLREVAMQASGLIISLVQEAASYAPSAELQKAAAVALVIVDTIQAVKDNKEAYKRLGEDSTALIVAIWRSYKKAESPDEWLSIEMQEILVELTHILDRICSFVRGKLSRSKAMRVIYSRADVGKIAEYRENLNSALQKFELQSHMNIDLKLGKLSEQIRYRNGLEIAARQARDPEETESIHEQETKVVKKISTSEHLKQPEIDEREHSEELKKGKVRQSELERLRADVRALEMANRLKKAEEEEILELRRKISAGRRNILPQAQPSKNKRGSTLGDEFEVETEEEELERKGNPRRSPGGPHRASETFRDDEEEEPHGRSKMRTTGRKANPRRSPGGPHRASETFTDDEEEPLRRSKMKTAGRKLSSTPLHFDETENQCTDGERSPPPKKSPKVARKPHIPPGSPPQEVDDLMAQFQRFGTPLGGSPHGSRPSSPMYYPIYGTPLPPSMTPDGYGYGYGGVMPGTIINTDVGNITNSIISNVGNNNSVQKVYRAPRNWRT